LPFYAVGMLALSARDVRGAVRPGRWPGNAAMARAADVVVLVLAVVGVVLVFGVLTAEFPGSRIGFVQPPPLLNAAFGLLVAVPFAGRILGDVVRRVLFVLAVVLATAIMWAADHALGARFGRAALRELAGFATTAALVLSLLVLRRPLWALID